MCKRWYQEWTTDFKQNARILKPKFIMEFLQHTPNSIKSEKNKDTLH